MNIEEEKLDLIKWLISVEDSQVIRKIRSLQKSNVEASTGETTNEEKLAIDQGLKSIEQGKFVAHDEVMRLTLEKYPQLFQ